MSRALRPARGFDAGHFYRENKGELRHTAKVAILDLGSVGGPVDIDKVRSSMSRRLHLAPPLTWKAKQVPGKLGHPVWVTEAEPNMHYHVRHVRCPGLGTDRDLCEVVGTMMSERLDRSRPLWQLWVVDGLDNPHHVAFVAKIHHAFADGGSALQMILDTATTAPGESLPEPGEGPFPPIQAEPEPGRIRLLVHAVGELIRLAGAFPGLIRDTAKSYRQGLARRRAGAPSAVAALSGPNTPFNEPVTNDRVFAVVDVPMDDLRAVKDAFGVTFNEAFMGVVSGAVRSHLLDRGEACDTAMNCVVPISVRPPERSREYGNWTSSVFPSLCTDIADPVARLRRIHEVATDAIEHQRSQNPYIMMRWFDFYPLFAAAIGSLQSLGKLAQGRPTFNMTVSNVRGPAQPLYAGTAEYVALYSWGPLSYDQGLNVTAWSYVDRLSICVQTFREACPDVWDLAERMPVELDRLVTLARS